MKNVKIVIGIVIVLLLAGCASSTPKPTFNPNKKHIVFKDGKPYRIPDYSIYIKIEDKQMLGLYNALELNCRMGDLVWYEKSAYNKRNKMIKESGTIGYGASLLIAKQNNAIGCSHKLSNQEYEYYREQKAQQLALINAQLADIQSRRNYRAATAPIKYEVDHTVSGSIDHTVYHY